MFPASTTMGGMCFAFPDVCKTPAPPAPPIPIPYPNTAQCPMALPPTCTMKVKILNMFVIHKNSEIPMTMGDQPGVAGGVISGVFMQTAKYKLGSMKVKFEGNEVVTLLKPTGQNGSNANAFGAQIAPSQVKVIVGG